MNRGGGAARADAPPADATRAGVLGGDPVRPGAPTLPGRDAERARALAFQVGYNLAGVCDVGPHPEHARLRDFLDRGYAGTMGYLEAGAGRRMDPREAVPWARSALVVGLVYETPMPHTADLVSLGEDPAARAPDPRLWISRYAWGRDYHRVMTRMNRRLVRRLKEAFGAGGRFYQYVDTGPLMEKVLAVRAGLGWMAKSTLVLHPRLGSWFFLGVVLTDLELAAGEPLPDRCGSCTRCLDVCPTGAFPEPYVLDATRCLSYRTIETREDRLPPDLGAGLGPHLFGCDLCQDVCPFNRKSPMSILPDFLPRAYGLAPRRSQVEAWLSDPGYGEARLSGSPLRRAGVTGLRRTLRWMDDQG